MRALSLAALLLPALAHGGTLNVDKTKSKVQVDGKATAHTFTGTLTDYKVTAVGNDQTLRPTTFKISWKFSDLKTANDKRDAAMMKWLGDAAAEGSFLAKKTWVDDTGTNVQGDLVIHGVTRTIAFPFTVKKEGNTVTIDGAAAIDYTQFGLPVIESLLMKVQPSLTIHFHLVGEESK